MGSGQRIAILRKRGGATPILTLSGAVAVGNLAKIRGLFSAFFVDVNGQSCDAIEIENVARFTFNAVEAYGSVTEKVAIGSNMVGALIGKFRGAKR